MKIKINWKELGKQLWNAVRCAAESEAFGGKIRQSRTRRVRKHPRSDATRGALFAREYRWADAARRFGHGKQVNTKD